MDSNVSAFYGCIFKTESEAAFFNYRMWESIGFIIALAYSNFICTQVKIFIIMAVLLLGMAGYLLIEIRTGMEGSETWGDLAENAEQAGAKYVINDADKNVELVAVTMDGEEFQGKVDKTFEEVTRL